MQSCTGAGCCFAGLPGHCGAVTAEICLIMMQPCGDHAHHHGYCISKLINVSVPEVDAESAFYEPQQVRR